MERSAVQRLPEELRDELNRRLVAGGFSDYAGLAEWLAAEGFEISRSSLHRYGQQFDRRLSALRVATEQARAIAEATGDDEGRLGDALTALVQQKAFEVLLEMEDAGEVSLAQLGTMVARLNTASVAQKRWLAEMSKRVSAAADAAVTIARQGGLSEPFVQQIRTQMLGITAAPVAASPSA